MTIMDNKDYMLFTSIAQLPTDKLLNTLETILKSKYNSQKITKTNGYILCEGTIPIMLVAHLDTVFTRPPEHIYYDRQKGVLWSPEGLGADDRAGVFSIFKILKKGYRPHVCLTTGEEHGGIGANMLVKDIPKPPFDIKYIVELDRQGSNDCVFYSCGNKEFETFVEEFGFCTDWGTFSDISDICPAWEIAGVNLSIGYFNEHSIGETLHVNYLYSTIKKVCKMLDSHGQAPYFKYIESPFTNSWLFDYPIEDEWERYYKTTDHAMITCADCHKPFALDDCLKVLHKNSSNIYSYRCIDCLNNSSKYDFCICCGTVFEKINESDQICGKCRKEIEEQK